MIAISPKQVAKFLSYIVLGIATASLTTQFFKIVLGRQYLLGLVDLFNVDNEANIPAWYSSGALLLCAILLGIVTLAKRQEGDRYTLHWAGLSCIFAFLSLDEAVSLHEGWLPAAIAASFQGMKYNWIVVGVCFVGIIALIYLPFLLALPAKTRFLMLLSGALFVSGALGIEWISNSYADVWGEENMTYAVMVFFEELLEMLGVVMFIYTLLSYIGTNVKEIYIGNPK